MLGCDGEVVAVEMGGFRVVVPERSRRVVVGGLRMFRGRSKCSAECSAECSVDALCVLWTVLWTC